jgi:hypothetical protein
VRSPDDFQEDLKGPDKTLWGFMKFMVSGDEEQCEVPVDDPEDADNDDPALLHDGSLALEELRRKLTVVKLELVIHSGVSTPVHVMTPLTHSCDKLESDSTATPREDPQLPHPPDQPDQCLLCGTRRRRSKRRRSV